MATYFRGNFKDIYDNNINIEIVSPNGQAEYNLDDEDSPVKIAYDSIEINYDMDDMFQTCIKKQMSLNLTSKIYLGDIIFSDKIREVSITVMKNDDVVFSGYVEPYTYSQPFAAVWEEFTINCIDKLGILEYEYLINHTRWQEYLAREDTPSFADYLSLIFDNEKVYYDGSKVVGNNDTSAFDGIGISFTPFLGKDEDDMMTNEEVLDEILKYLNLHIIQEGEDFYIFDWNTIKANSQTTFINIFDNEDTKEIDLSKNIITKDSYKGNDTNISMSDTYNQISLKADLDFTDEVLENPLDKDSVKYYSDYKQLFCSEYFTSGDGRSSNDSFKNIIQQGYDNYKNIDDDWDGWYRRDWYFKLAYNPQWKLMWNNIDTNEWIEKDENDKVINQQRILEVMRNYSFFPTMMSIGKNEDELNKDNKTMLSSSGDIKGKIPMDNYLVISVNGHFDDNSDAELQRIQQNINTAGGYYTETVDGVEKHDFHGLFEYTGNASLSLSPADDKTTNYLVIKSKMILNPIMRKSAPYRMNGGYGQSWYTEKKECEDNITLKQQVDWIRNDGFDWFFTVPVTDNGNDGRYAQQFYGATYPGDEEYSLGNSLLLYPFTNDPKAARLNYNYSAHWDDTDKIDKLPVLECELKIGDKYLVETYPSGDKLKPQYGWYTEDNLPLVKVDATHTERKHTFSIGFDPAIGSPIVGKEYDISNTVNGRISDESGMAIPIKNSDNLAGKLHFKILCPINQQWNEITRRHPTLFRSTKYYDNYYNLWSYVSSIMVKDFEINVISDNLGSDVVSQEADVVYISNQPTTTIEKKDDIEFKVCTKPTTAELIARGINTNVANNTTIEISTNKPLTDIKDTIQNIQERPERLYIDQYWNIYNTPKAIIETTLDSSFGKMKMVNFSDFGDAIPISIKQNLQFATTTIKAIQI